MMKSPQASTVKSEGAQRSVLSTDGGISVAAIIVTYKSAQFTIEGLHSLARERKLTGLNVHTFVVDNASGDTPAIDRAVQEFGWSGWVTVITASRNGGFAFGNNLGMRAALAHGNPTYIYLLNPDAQVRPRALQMLVNFLEANSAASIAGSSFENLDGSDWPLAFRFPTLLSELCQGMELSLINRLLKNWVVPRVMDKRTQRVDWICGASMLIRSSILRKVGGFDENYFLYFEETDFCFRANLLNFSTWYVPDSRVMHVAGQSTKMTERDARPKRLPQYWFESRRRYFAVTHGIGYAMFTDLVAVIAYSIGNLKRLTMSRRHATVPFFVRDLIRHSLLWQRNRKPPPARTSVHDAT